MNERHKGKKRGKAPCILYGEHLWSVALLNQVDKYRQDIDQNRHRIDIGIMTSCKEATLQMKGW
jgi:hypothetical protein